MYADREGNIGYIHNSAVPRRAAPCPGRGPRLARWDRVADTASVETTWFTLMVERRMARRQSGDGSAEPGGDPSWVAALADALRLLREEKWGTAEVAWGRINRHQRPLPGDPARALDPDRQSLPVGGASGGFGTAFSYYSSPVDGPAGPRIGPAGNSFVKISEFGPTPTARSVLSYCQSGDPGVAPLLRPGGAVRPARSQASVVHAGGGGSERGAAVRGGRGARRALAAALGRRQPGFDLFTRRAGRSAPSRTRS